MFHACVDVDRVFEFLWKPPLVWVWRGNFAQAEEIPSLERVGLSSSLVKRNWEIRKYIA